MLSHKILTGSSVREIAHYYDDSKDDYYTKEGEVSGWTGTGAEMLGLSGGVEQKAFLELLNGQLPDGRAIHRDSIRADAQVRYGIDLTFSAPKSVSMQALIGDDPSLMTAHDLAVEAALKRTELFASARRKEGGISHVERTGNLAIAKFRHETNRDGEPQLHTHALVLNMTRRSDGAWRALRNDDIIKQTKVLGAFYRAELAAHLRGAATIFVLAATVRFNSRISVAPKLNNSALALCELKKNSPNGA
jgi:conjugative relaxase-like TrwC/TraI family protein